MSGPTFLKGDRVTLRPVERDDVEIIQRARNDPDIRVPVGMRHPKNRNQVEADFEEWYESDESVNLLVCVEGDPIGEVTIMHFDWTRPELAYWLVPEHHGHGYATEALELLIDYFFESFEKHGLHARTFDYNEASAGLLEKLGFTREARLRQHRFVGGEYVDSLLYGLLREEWVAED